MGFKKTQSDALDLNLLQQTYDKTVVPTGVEIVKLNVFPDDQGGWFKENLRLDEDGCVLYLKEKGIEFKVVQSNTSYIGSKGKRFWHIHPKKDNRPGQNEIWITNRTLLVGLVDLRKDSATHGVKTKVILSEDKALYIPSGIAHGFINPNDIGVTLTYFTDQHFTASEQTQEHRIDPKELPFDFVEPEVM